MRYVSTRRKSDSTEKSQSLSAAIAAGLAPDGGLYVPESIPRFDPEQFQHVEDLPSIAKILLAPFFQNDALQSQLDDIIDEAFCFPILLRTLQPELYALELFHGPTAAFKDVGARFLASCIGAMQNALQTELTILVATSGDTGAAVAAAFHRKPGIRVVILYPDGGVSARQAHQLGSFGDNVEALRVAGSFDDCQRMVKAMFNDHDLRTRMTLASANSISLGRLLPQMSYYAFASMQHWRNSQSKLNFIVPTGNLGNAFAAILARAMGLPIGQICLVSNANDVLPRYLHSGVYEAKASVRTLANAMDVGHPSNVERLNWLYPKLNMVEANLDALSVQDETIRNTIRIQYEKFGEIWCPHSACGFAALDDAMQAGRQKFPVAVVATAHPAKFETVVEPLIQRPLVAPAALQNMLDRPAFAHPIRADQDEFRRYLLATG